MSYHFTALSNFTAPSSYEQFIAE